jgi:amino acid transporter
VTLTAITAALGVYLASVVGYARIAFAMGRDGTLPAFFGRLHPRYKIPWVAQHIAFLLALGVGALWCRWLGVYMAYDWWGTVLVFFAMISNIFVDIGCAVFFYRFRRALFSTFWHLLLPVLGIATSLLPLYYSFGPSLWRQGWKRGESVVLFSLLMLVLATGYTVVWAAFRPEALRTAL